MRRTFLTLAAAFLFLTALPLAAQTGAWTAVGSTGVIDEASVGIYQFGATNLTYNPGSGSLSNIVARYNVTNTWGASDTPPWAWLEMGYLDNNPSANLRADLFQVNPCTGIQTLLCSVNSIDNPTATCHRCNFTPAINFGVNLYYVQVTLSRTTLGVAPPHLYTLRIF